MTVPDSGSDIHRLVSAAQGSVRDLDTLHDYRAKRVRLRFAYVQAFCALALAINNLANAVWALVTSEEKQ